MFHILEPIGIQEDARNLSISNLTCGKEVPK